jgi:hypothetical protein
MDIRAKLPASSAAALGVVETMNRAEAIIDVPGKVTGVVPADTATHIQLDQTIRWSRAVMAQSYDVYIGPNAGALVKVSAAQAARTYVSTLALDSTYYIRIDSKNTLGTTTGDVTSFTTWAEADILTDENGVPLTDETGAYLEDS